MDSFFSKLIQAITDFLETLPPLLQLLAGVFMTLAIIKIFLVIVNFIEDKREGKK